MTVRFGLMGSGHWANIVHAPGLAAHPEVEFVGIHGRDQDKLAKIAADHGTRPYADVDALIADVDALAFAAPPDVQALIAIRAAAAGKHLLLEKPPALDLATADRLVEAVDGSGVSTIVFFTQRFV